VFYEAGDLNNKIHLRQSCHLFQDSSDQGVEDSSELEPLNP